MFLNASGVNLELGDKVQDRATGEIGIVLREGYGMRKQDIMFEISFPDGKKWRPFGVLTVIEGQQIGAVQVVSWKCGLCKLGYKERETARRCAEQHASQRVKK